MLKNFKLLSYEHTDTHTYIYIPMVNSQPYTCMYTHTLMQIHIELTLYTTINSVTVQPFTQAIQDEQDMLGTAGKVRTHKQHSSMDPYTAKTYIYQLCVNTELW